MSVVGNRPQFVKAAAVWPHLEQGNTDQLLVHTGQHYDRELSEVFFEELGLKPPARNLDAGSGSHAEQTGRIMSGLEAVVAEAKPDLALIYGDTNTTLAAALVAAKASLPAAHVEAGVRSFDRSTPEEINRLVADVTSGLLLCPTQTAVENLTAEGLGDRARLVGDVMLDVAQKFGPIADRRSDVVERLELEPHGYFLATAHRAGNVDDPQKLGRVVEVLQAARELAPVIFAVHPRTRARLTGDGLITTLEDAGIVLIEPLGYLAFARLLRSARAVLTDSGGVQKEAYLAAVPCVTLRDATEWVETVESGWNRLVSLDPAAAVEALSELAELRDRARPDPGVYGDGMAGARVAAEIERWLTSLSTP
ncbi:MAG: UDP-N-acetylglucosamine 2-epimerase (non-hydrolyzing) [Gaiellaceae bacterium MAG52_C11]|nr:UDP-N-acetylglucosamine 2-epimerase (non-hydrolyzing) [Candidatus Gaiellasilicea maunaloa]